MVQGRMEFGPRALGCRSILGDARSPTIQQTMNLKIKFRESFRPFAPCVLRECVDTVFTMRPNEDSPYMLVVASVQDSWHIPLEADNFKRMQDPDLRVRVSVPRSQVPAITHVDYSARIQTVDAERHALLSFAAAVLCLDRVPCAREHQFQHTERTHCLYPSRPIVAYGHRYRLFGT
jgi:carbamoyltransferase